MIGAVSTYVLGFLFCNQIYTWLLVVLGSGLCIAYYSVTGPTPLWDAIIGSSLIALAIAQPYNQGQFWSRKGRSRGRFGIWCPQNYCLSAPNTLSRDLASLDLFVG